jgi:aspartyl-tRNA(Asn)/glutamyl-tRNA(Gln) amidotransferase subunit C
VTFEKSDVAKIARLARLSISSEEVSRLQRDLDRIVTFVAQLREVNTEGVMPMSHAGDRLLSWREDIPSPTLGRECVKSSAGYEDGLIRVPRIIG